MQKIRILIVEDSSLIAADIAVRLQRHNMEVVNVCESGEDALELITQKNPDLILMDIQLAGALDGVSTAALIREKFEIPIIYLSDHTDNDRVKRALKTFPAAYLSKPFHEPDLIRALEIAFTNHQPQRISSPFFLSDHVFVKAGQAYIKLALADILYLKADRSYCQIVTRDKTYTETNNMKFVWQRINHPSFVQVHRSCVVNINHVTGIDGNVISLGDQTVEMSQAMREDFMSRLKLIR